jgi:hypothetical protein
MLAQTFMFDNNVSVSQVTLRLQKVNNPTGTITLEVRTTSGGQPTATVLASATLACSEVSTTATNYTFNLNTAIDLTGGTTYAVTISASAAIDPTYYIRWISNTSSSYANGQVYTSTNSGSSWTSVSTADMRFSITGEYLVPSTKTVTANGVTSGEYKVNVTADGTNFRIYLDDVQAATTALSGVSVSNNANGWVFVQNGVMPYVEYIKFTNSGTLRGHWYWQYAATFTDQSGNSNTATPTFRTTSTDPAVSAVVKSFTAFNQAIFSGADSEAPVFVTNDDIPGMPGGWYVNLDASNFPGGPSINAFLDSHDIPYEIVYLPFVYVGGALITMVAFRYTRKLLPAALGGVLWTVFWGATIGSGLWGLLPIGVITIGEMVNRKKASL